MLKLVKDTIIPHQSQTIDLFWDMAFTESEIILYGPAECSKTFEGALFMHFMCATIPNFQGVILRKAKTTIYSTILQTLKYHILPYGLIDSSKNLINSYGGPNTPQWLDYKETGARLWFLGEDDKTGKALGTEWDAALFSQVEQASAEFWEQLSGRCTGRAGNWIVNGLPHGVCLGECNPGPDKHHLRNRWRDGRCKMLKFTHKDSPKLYLDNEYTDRGKRVIPALKNKYTGHLHERLYKGNWVGVSGGVYTKEYDPNIHDVEEEQILDEVTDEWNYSLSIDFGTRHPFVAVLFISSPYFTESPETRKIFCFKEIYKTDLDPNQMVNEVLTLIRNWVPKHKELLWTVADHEPGYHKLFEKEGIRIRNAIKQILPGIANVKDFLHKQQVFFNKDSLTHAPDENQLERGFPTRSTDEFQMYAYKPKEKQTGAKSDEEPIALHNDFCDALKYELAEITKPDREPVQITPESIPKVRDDIFVTTGSDWI